MALLEPIPNLQCLARAVNAIPSKFNLLEILQLHQNQRQVGDLIVSEIEHLKTHRELPEFPGSDAIVAQIEHSDALIESAGL